MENQPVSFIASHSLTSWHLFHLHKFPTSKTYRVQVHIPRLHSFCQWKWQAWLGVYRTCLYFFGLRVERAMAPKFRIVKASKHVKAWMAVRRLIYWASCMLAVYRMTTAHRAESFEHVWVMFAMCVWSFGEDKVSVACAWKDGRCLRMPEWDSTVQRRVCRFQLHLWRDCQRSTWFISIHWIHLHVACLPQLFPGFVMSLDSFKTLEGECRSAEH